MKKLLLLFAMVLMAMAAMAQSTGKISYQAVVRDGNNRLVTGTNVTVDVRVTSSTGTYEETGISATTNANGLVSLLIGNNTGFDDIDWSTASITTAVNIGSETVTNTVPVTAVPFALYASNGGPIGSTLQVIYDKIKADSLLLQGNIDTVSAEVRSALIDTAAAIRNDIVQSDWTENDATSGSFIQNRPTLAPVATNGDYNFLVNTPDLDQYVNKEGTNEVSATNNFSGVNDFSNTVGFSSTVTVPQAVNQSTLEYTNDEMQAVSYKDLMFLFDSLQNQINRLQAALDGLQDTVSAIHDNSAPEYMGMTLTPSCDQIAVTASFSSPSGDITGYEFAISANSDMSAAITQETTEPTYTFTGLTSGTVYYVTATATNANGTTTSTIEESDMTGTIYFTTFNANRNCSEIHVFADFSSNSCASVSSYRVNLATNRAMTDIVDYSDNTDAYFWIGGDVTYYVSAQAVTTYGTIYSDTVEVAGNAWDITGLDIETTCHSVTITPHITGNDFSSLDYSYVYIYNDNGYEDWLSSSLTEPTTISGLEPNTQYNIEFNASDYCYGNKYYSTEFTTSQASDAVVYDSLSIVTNCNSVTVTPHFTTTETNVKYRYMLLYDDWGYVYTSQDVTSIEPSYTFTNVDSYYPAIYVKVQMVEPCGPSSPNVEVLMGSSITCSLDYTVDNCGNITVTPDVSSCNDYSTMEGHYYWYLYDSDHHQLSSSENYACCNADAFEVPFQASLESNRTYFVKYRVVDDYYSGDSYEKEIEVHTPDFESSVTFNNMDISNDCGVITVTPDYTSSVPLQYKYTLWSLNWGYDENQEHTITTADAPYTFPGIYADPWGEYYVEVEAIPTDGSCSAKFQRSEVSSVNVTFTRTETITADAIIFTFTFSEPVNYNFYYTETSDGNTSTGMSYSLDDTHTVLTVSSTGWPMNTTLYASMEFSYCGNYYDTWGEQFTTLSEAGAPVYLAHEATSAASGESINLSSEFSTNGSEITAYGFLVGTTDNPTEATPVTGLTTASYSYTSTTPNTTYYVWATATNANGTTTSTNYVQVTTLEGVPVYTNHTVSSSDQAGTSLTASASFEEGGSEITNYTFYVGTTNVLADATEVNNGTNATLTYTTEPNTIYYVWVSAENSIGSATSPSYKSVTTAGAPVYTSLVLDSTSATGNLLKATATFNDNRSTITDYTFYVGTTDVFSDAVATSNGTSVIFNYTAEPGNTYYVWVAATNGVGTTVSNVYKTGTMIDYATVSTLSAMLTSASTANLTGEVTADGGAPVTERGFCWSHSNTPTIENTYLAVAGTMGEFTAEMSGLAMGSIYNVRAYAITSVGVAYGDNVQFQVGSGTPPAATLPVVATRLIPSSPKPIPLFGGEIVSDGGADITERGLCWSLYGEPTIDSLHLSSPTATSIYTVTISNQLPTETTYYLRAYAVNELGLAYGDVIEYTTPADLCLSQVITDYDGNEYSSVRLGTQCWMAQNIRSTHYANGNSISAYRSPGNNSSLVPTYGYMYSIGATKNGHADSDAVPSGVQGICPDGWHVPSWGEWEILINYLQSVPEYVCDPSEPKSIAKVLASTSGWTGTPSSPCDVSYDQANTNNITGFSIYPTGHYYTGDGLCKELGGESCLWSTSFSTGGRHWGFLTNNGSKWGQDSYYAYDGTYNPVRCVKDED